MLLGKSRLSRRCTQLPAKQLLRPPFKPHTASLRSCSHTVDSQAQPWCWQPRQQGTHRVRLFPRPLPAHMTAQLLAGSPGPRVRSGACRQPASGPVTAGRRLPRRDCGQNLPTQVKQHESPPHVLLARPQGAREERSSVAAQRQGEAAQLLPQDATESSWKTHVLAAACLRQDTVREERQAPRSPVHLAGGTPGTCQRQTPLPPGGQAELRLFRPVGGTDSLDKKKRNRLSWMEPTILLQPNHNVSFLFKPTQGCV